jgi:hypothetical protein
VVSGMMIFLVFRHLEPWQSYLHLWSEKLLRAWALVTRMFYHSEALPKFVYGLWAFCQTTQGGEISEKYYPTI